MSSYISKQEAINLVKRFREHRPVMLNSNYGSATLPFCETFDAAQVQKVIDNGAASIRLYAAMNSRNEMVTVIVGVDAAGKEIVPASAETVEEGYLIEMGRRCPDDCPTDSELYP